MDKLNLLPCPFCGGEANKNAYDRGIDIGCASCGYSRHFPGLLQSNPNDKPIVQYRNGQGGITEIPASEATEFYHADANERAVESWNRRAAPSSSADELPPLPDARAIRAGHAFPKVYALGYTADMMQEYARHAIAADRIARQGEPVGADGFKRVEKAAADAMHVFSESCNHTHQAIDYMKAVLVAELERTAIQAAAPADAPTINPMCELKTNHIIERDGYAKSGYVLRKEGADICVSDGGAVAWFTPEQWSWLMFNRMHTTFDWPKPIGWRAPAEDAREGGPKHGSNRAETRMNAGFEGGTEDAREQQQDGEPRAASLAAILREIIVSAKADRAWLIADRARNALHMLAAIESCRATGTDRAQAGEDA